MKEKIKPIWPSYFFRKQHKNYEARELWIRKESCCPLDNLFWFWRKYITKIQKETMRFPLLFLSLIIVLKFFCTYFVRSSQIIPESWKYYLLSDCNHVNGHNTHIKRNQARLKINQATSLGILLSDFPSKTIGSGVFFRFLFYFPNDIPSFFFIPLFFHPHRSAFVWNAFYYSFYFSLKNLCH